MAKGRISSSSKKSMPSETTVKRVTETERLNVVAQKVSVVLTPCDLITDIDCNFTDETKETCEKVASCTTENDDASCSERSTDQKCNGAEHLTEGNVADNDVRSPSNGFSPVGFYGSKKQNLTPRVKLFSPNARKILREECGKPIGKCSPGVKRKNKKQSNSSMVKKKCRTSNVARQCKSVGSKNKYMSTAGENYSHLSERETLVSKPANVDNSVENSVENKKGTEFCKLVTNGGDRSSVENSCLPQLVYDSEGSVIGSMSSISTRSSPCLSKAAMSNPSEAESVCSETSLYSGPGSVTNSLLLRKSGNEYFFDNSIDDNTQSSEQLTSREINQDRTDSFANGEMISNLSSRDQNMERLVVKTPDCFDFVDESQSSFSISMPSPDTSESDFTLKLSEKDADSSSNKSSPEHQAPITKYFKSITVPKCRTKLITNGASYLGMSSAENSPEVKNRISPPNRGKRGKKQEQMYLDLGQKDFGHVTCPTCGMVYTRAQPDDEAEHIRHHKSFVSGLRFTGWKNECVIKEFHDGRVIMVGPDGHPLHLKKVEEIRKVVDSELGFVADVPCRISEAKTFLFITGRKVIGCAVAVQINEGYPVLPSPGESSTPEKQIAAWCCRIFNTEKRNEIHGVGNPNEGLSYITTPQSAQCGISRIWVHSQRRRKKVATRLLDCVRMHFIYGCIIPRELVAFSDPTPDGKRLAKSYAGTSQFLVFR